MIWTNHGEKGENVVGVNREELVNAETYVNREELVNEETCVHWESAANDFFSNTCTTCSAASANKNFLRDLHLCFSHN